MSLITTCDKCGTAFQHRANYLHTELLGSGTCMVDIQVAVQYAGFRRDVCDACVDGLLQQLLAERAAESRLA